MREPVKDEEAEHPVADAWRPLFREINRAFMRGDFALAHEPPGVTLRSPGCADQIQRTLTAWGETLVELPDETWTTSVALWMGDHWEVVVDLWTAESGRIDLIIDARVYEAEGGYRIEVGSVHVP